MNSKVAFLGIPGASSMDSPRLASEVLKCSSMDKCGRGKGGGSGAGGGCRTWGGGGGFCR